ncbi:PIN-like domain-containing protein [Pseudomonas syringae]|uniref:PIN-like domain-containing protein n=1 Tax=Pseudomonas syringae TaxID=317 RepID=UPI0004212ED2|nr:PIN domain-containing protein [Pseudomonas syringae]
MKGLFPQFDNAYVVNYTAAWNDALFVFDTNILLNLYRYQFSAREELITILNKLSNRIWIPHHVALEFQRNRLSVISAQGRGFAEIRNVLNKAQTGLAAEISKLNFQNRHALINTDALLEEFNGLVDKFRAQLDEQQEAQQKPMANDPLKYRIEELFEGKVGECFKDQPAVESASKEAEARYKFKIPPGYEDDDKDKDGPDEFMHSGILFKKKYGDYFAWIQILNHARQQGVKSLIFVTDDAKEDWWSIVSFNGPKTIGARPELIEEASRVGGIDNFIMYKPESFLQYAKTYLEASVSEDTLNEVRDVSSSNKAETKITDDLSISKIAEICVHDLLVKRFGSVPYNLSTYPDFIVGDGLFRKGFEVKCSFLILQSIYIEAISQAMSLLAHEEFESFTIVFVVPESIDTNSVLKSLLRNPVLDVPENLIIAIAQIIKTPTTFKLAIAYEDSYNNLNR